MSKINKLMSYYFYDTFVLGKQTLAKTLLKKRVRTLHFLCLNVSPFTKLHSTKYAKRDRIFFFFLIYVSC